MSPSRSREEIALDPRNRDAVAALIQAFQRRQGIIPFVGAGLSFDWGFPLWGMFLVEVSRTAGIEAQVQKVLDGEDYELAAQSLELELGRREFNRLIAERFGKALNARHIPSAAVHLLPGIATGPVITTNFDSVLETAFKAAGYAFDLPPLWGAKSQLAIEGLAEDYSMLLKIHGDARHPDERVLTLEEYEYHYGGLTSETIDRGKPLPQLLERLFTSRSVMFLGCSLGPDRTVSILSRIARLANAPEHFAVVEAPEEPERFQERDSFLRDHGIIPIWYPRASHHLLRPFLRFLRRQVPRQAVGYRTIPGPVRAADSRESARRTRAVRRAITDVEKERGLLLAEWNRLSSTEDRSAFLRRHRDYFRDHSPRDLLRLAGQAAEGARDNDPVTAAEYLITRHLAARRIGDEKEAEASIAAAAALLESQKPGIIHVDLLHTRALAARARGALDFAERFSRQALKLARKIELSAPYALRSMWHLRAGILADLRKPRPARRYAAWALWSARKDLDRDGIVRNLILVSNLYFAEHQPRKMVRAVRRALKQADRKDVQSRATICDNLGVALFELGDYPQALAAYREALWYEQQGNVAADSIVITLMNLAWLEFNAFDGRDILDPGVSQELRVAALHRSRDYYSQALALVESLGDQELRAHVLTQQALVIGALGDISRALADLRTATKVFRARRDFSSLATLLNNRGRIWEQAQNGTHNAIRAYLSALQVARESGEPGILRTILYNYASLLKAEGRYGEALPLAAELHELDKDHPDALTAKHESLFKALKK